MEYMDLDKEQLIDWLVKIERQLDELKKKTSEISIIDEVTSLYNKKGLYKSLDYEIRRAQRQQGYLSVLILGINNFRAIKEKYSEEIANIILIQISRLIKISIRNIDIIGRYGEGEFMIILPDMNPNKGIVVAERIQRLMDKEIFPIESRVTLCYGLKHYEGEPVNKLLEIAETNLNLARKDLNR